ncbi:MAG TPA: hypothetical protein VHP83_13930 [Aggregatilineaceae bacterium]|nr:hypothetical protein [Aggregatilineaceae bacterium]
MSALSRNVNFDVVLKNRQQSKIEFWRNNGDGTCTRLSDELTVTLAEYNTLPGNNAHVPWRDNN